MIELLKRVCMVSGVDKDCGGDEESYNLIVMEKYHRYESWLKANDHVSWKSYLSFVLQIEKELIMDIETIKSPSILKQLLKQLKSKASFNRRSKSDQDNILSGFRNYIRFVEETKKMI